MKNEEVIKAKEVLEKKYEQELEKEIVNRFDMYCESVDECNDCEYTSGYRFQYDDRHICLAKFLLVHYNVSRKLK